MLLATNSAFVKRFATSSAIYVCSSSMLNIPYILSAWASMLLATNSAFVKRFATLRLGMFVFFQESLFPLYSICMGSIFYLHFAVSRGRRAQKVNQLEKSLIPYSKCWSVTVHPSREFWVWCQAFSQDLSIVNRQTYPISSISISINIHCILCIFCGFPPQNKGLVHILLASPYPAPTGSQWQPGGCNTSASAATSAAQTYFFASPVLRRRKHPLRKIKCESGGSLNCVPA